MSEGPIVVVTGASRGIGRAIASRFATEGARVVAVARDPGALRALAGEFDEGNVLPVAADVCDPGSMQALRDRVLAERGQPDLVVANAGRLEPIGPLWEADPDSWWKDVEVNLRGSFLTVHSFLPSMIEAGRGRVVLFGGGGSTGLFPWVSAYAISKAALLRLAETLDHELEGTGVCAFAVSPGFVRTDMTERFAATEAGRRYIGDLARRLDEDEASSPEYCAELLVRINRGDLDGLRGRFVHATADADRLDELAARATEIVDADERVLTMKGFAL